MSMTLGKDVSALFPDVLKNIAMALVATAVHRAFPDLLGRRTTPEPVGAARAS